MDPEVRKRLGKHYRTMSEVNQDNEHKSERQLQGQIANLLNLREIAYCWHRTDKKSHATIGWPDFTASVFMQKLTKNDPTDVVPVTVALALEVKLPGKKLSPEQETMFRKMTKFPNAWMCRVVYSVDDVLAILKELGL
jgi:hypothetical protein